VAIFLALAGYLATYASNRLLAQRQAQLERINSQLNNLYGPLLADQALGKAAWKVYEETGEKKWWDEPRSPPDDEQSAQWQALMDKVFQPTNRRMLECVKANAALLLEDHMPECLIHLAAHSAAYNILAVRWAEPKFVATRREDLVAPGKFPGDELEKYVRASFTKLKQDQLELLGKLSGSVRIHQTFAVARSPEDVFGFMVQPENLPKWQSDKTYVTPLTGVPTRLGSRFREGIKVGPRRWEQEVEVVQFEPGRLFAVKVIRGPEGSRRWLIEPDGAGVRVEFDGDFNAPRLLGARWSATAAGGGVM
jgi:Polyketide cyclase / dehydrase and lipid transport